MKTIETLETGIFRRSYVDSKTGQRKWSDKLYIAYYDINGKQITEAVGSGKITHARKLRASRIDDVQEGKPTGPRLARTTWDELAQDLIDFYKLNERRSINTLHFRLKHLNRYFEGARAATITTARINRYAVDRKAEGASNSTINREGATLRTALRLGLDNGKVAAIPKIRALEEPPAREGFVRVPTFQKMRDYMAEQHPHHVGWLEVAFYSGWRKGTILGLTWLDVRDGWLYAPGLKTKNKKSVRRKLDGPLGQAVMRQLAFVKRVQKLTGTVVQQMFVYPDARPIRCPEAAFKAAAKHAGVPDLTIHDLCRSTWQLMVNAGIPEKDIMDAVGRKTRSIADRYNITDEDRLAAVDQRLGDVLTGSF